jgi:peptidoglycan hydrolase-like protein with peptidoglycan-binding domain
VNKDMQKFGFIIVALAVMALGAGCGKKQKSLEEMQEPMSMESLRTLKAEGTAQQAQGEAQPAQGEKAAVNQGAPLEPLPPSGPYQPTAVEIQTALQGAGYYTGAIDGKIGPRTKKAIEEFQQANGLVADGKVGRKTWALLSKHLSAAPAAAATPDN